MSVSAIVKLKVLLPHWAAHNSEHSSELREWQREVSGNADVAALLTQAADLLDRATVALEIASDKLGSSDTGLENQVGDHSHVHPHHHQ
jgi:hypothetical protein